MTNIQQPLMQLRSPQDIGAVDGIIEGYQRYQVLLSSLELGLFEFLDSKGSGTRDEISEGIGINGLFAHDFLNVLAEAGLIALDGEHYRNAGVAKDFLLPGNPFYQGGVVRNIVKHSSWSDLTAFLTRKEPAQGSGGTLSPGPSAAFIDALGQKALRGELQSVTQTITRWSGFAKARRILDVGGGHGLYIIALCQANPHLTGVVLDQADVVDTTKRTIANHGLTDRISAEVGDICGDSIGAGYDIVLISHLLYKFRKNLAPIFDAVCVSLNSGGLFVSNHWFCFPECAVGESAVQGLSKALQSFGHPLCREEEFDRLFAEKGFDIVTTTSAKTTFGLTRLQLAEKRKEHP